MNLKTKTVGLTEEISVTAHEADGRFDSIYDAVSVEAKKGESPDKTFDYFHLFFYPLLAACTHEPVPDVRTAYDLPREKLDEWYKAIWQVNPDILTKPFKEPEKENITFRDGSEIVVYETQDLPSFILRLHQLEEQAQSNPSNDPGEVAFRLAIYPKIAACVNGSKIPSADEACSWPRVELSRWSDAAMRLNPDWFSAILDAAQRNEAEKVQVKKKRSRRPANRPAE